MIDARIYKPSVANNESTIFLNIEFVKTSVTDKGPVASATFSIPLNASTNAAA